MPDCLQSSIRLAWLVARPLNTAQIYLAQLHMTSCVLSTSSLLSELTLMQADELQEALAAEHAARGDLQAALDTLVLQRHAVPRPRRLRPSLRYAAEAGGPADRGPDVIHAALLWTSARRMRFQDQIRGATAHHQRHLAPM